MQAGQIDKLGLWFPGDPIVNHDPDRSSSAVSDTGPENRLLSTANSQAQPPRSLPCVVQLGFVGARHLFDTSTLSAEEAEKLQAEALHLLRQTCIALRDDLKLEPHQFVAAISQLAIGADMLVAQVCQSFDQPIPHRVFLPQLTAAFLDASNENGTPDFLPAEKAIVVNLLKSPSIIQERVVSRSNSRSDRSHPPHLLVDLLGILAIVLPVVAVSGLSWAAAFDCEARIETFAETGGFLRRQRPVLEMADTEAEFERLLVETEMVLLGEIANWYSRRANTHIT